MADVMYKFGYTTEDNAEDRYLVSHDAYNFNKVNLAKDYNLKTEWSAWVSKERALQMEDEWAARYEFNIDIMKDNLAEYNGISECRIFTESQWGLVSKRYYGCKEKKESVYRKSGDHKVYIMKFTKKK